MVETTTTTTTAPSCSPPASSPPPPPHPPFLETTSQRWSRKSRNAVTRSVGFLEKSAWLARSSVVQHWEIAARKRQFGTEYMTLMQQGASEAQLTECVETAQLELDALTAKALQFQERANCVDRFTQTRLVHKPKAAATATPTTAATDPTQHWNYPPPSPSSTPTDSDDDDKLMKFKSINGINVGSGSTNSGLPHQQFGQSKTTASSPAPSAPFQVGLHPDVQHAFTVNNTDDVYDDKAPASKKASSIPYTTATIVSSPPRSATPGQQQQQLPYQKQYQPSAPPAELDKSSHK